MEDKRKKLLGKLSKLVKAQTQPQPFLPPDIPERPYRPTKPECTWRSTPYASCEYIFGDVLPFGCPEGTAARDRRSFKTGTCKDVDGKPLGNPFRIPWGGGTFPSNCPGGLADECNRFGCDVCDPQGRIIPNCAAIPCFDGPGDWNDPPGVGGLPPDSPFAIDPPVPGGPAVPSIACLCGLVKKNSDGSYVISDDEFRRNYCGVFGSRKPCEYVTDENGRPILDDDGRAQYVDPNCIPTFCPHIKNTQNDNPLAHGHVFCSDVGSGTDRDPLTIPETEPGSHRNFRECIKEYCRRFPHCSAPIRFPNTPSGPSAPPPPSRWRGWTAVTLANPCVSEIMQRINTVCTDISNVKPDENPLIDSQPEKDPSDRMTIEDQLP